MRKVYLFALLSAAFVFAATDAEKTALRTPPLPRENMPQFVVLGSDDNTSAEAVRWMQGVVDKYKNKDGSKVYMSFYVNTDQSGAVWDGKNDLIDAVYNAYKAGHEIGNHTSTHLYCVEYGKLDPVTKIDNGRRVDKNTIFNEIKRVQDVLVKAGIPRTHQTGFRTPYLRYSDSTFTAMSEVGFLYDCSVSAASDNVAGTNFFPYKLDAIKDENGNYAPDNSADVNTWGKTSVIRKHENLWELPAVQFAIDPQDTAYVKGVLGIGGDEEFDGYITGLDYNLWNEAHLDSGQTVRSLMRTLNLSLAGNRAPLTIGCHSQYYFQAKNSEFPKIPPEKRRQAFEEFVKQASQIENVFFVSGDMVIRWMQNPVSAAEFKPENYIRAPFTDKTAPTKIRLSNTSVDEGDLDVGTLTAVNLNKDLTHTFSIVEGDDIFAVDGDKLKFKSAVKSNTNANKRDGYGVKVRAEASGGAGAIDWGFTIWVDSVFNTEIEFVERTWSGWCDDDGIPEEKPEEARTGSAYTVPKKAKTDPLVASLTLGENKIVNGKTYWPSVEVSTSYSYALTGLKEIVVTYTSDKDVSLGIGKWTQKMSFGFAATLPASTTEKTFTLTPDMFDMTYSEYENDAERARVPGSLRDALGTTGLSISFSGVDEGTTTNIKVSSLKFKGIPNKSTPQKTSIAQDLNKKLGAAITLSGVSSNKINLNVAKAGVYQVDIYAVNGRRLFSEKQNLRAGTNFVSIKGIAKGVAVIRVSGLNASLQQKFIIK